MGLSDLLTSKRSGMISAVSMVVEAGLALYRGDKKIAALLLGAAALAYRWSFVGAIAEILIRAYQRLR
ncbi:hypothetical protein [Halococcus saccharolyticus]|uniref:Uncharacterized protein n=1 Tax=Halococcus saccharolyticus DSM 5350 TaxID=1227455 RepID=M0MKM2_9EURY|nr:hypothetical protein [Halococcus saccharolyticus]EMA46242.1 hypothetical protein C449_04395 [Halococcus saccharolyticus DSM 5350]